VATTLAEIAETPIGDIVRRTPVQVGPDTSLGEVVARLCEGGRGAVVVIEASQIVGILSERDVMLRIDHGDPAWRGRAVSTVMTPAPRTVRADQTIEESINLMITGGHRHLPIVAASGELVGIVSIRDVLLHIVGFFPADFLNLPPDPQHEARERWGG
jgi:CBS domain-containing protein